MSDMNWTLAEDSWQQFKGTVRARWLQLNDEHLDAIGGKRPALLRKIHWPGDTVAGGKPVAHPDTRRP